jgi:protoporphyrinogen oxidase
MTIKDLKEKIDRLCEKNPDLQVKVLTCETSIGGSAGTLVKGAYQGIDFDKYYFLISTEEKIVKITDEQLKNKKELEKETGWLYYELNEIVKDRNLFNQIRKILNKYKKVINLS